MPALPNVPLTLRLDFFQTVGQNTRVRDRIFLHYTGAVSVTDLNTLLTTVSNAWNTNISPQQSSIATLTAIQGTDLQSASGAQSILAVSRAGTDAATLAPNGAAAVVKFRIARRYRGGHPRFYLGGPSGAELNNSNSWKTTYVTALSNAFAAFIAAVVLAPPAGIGVLSHVNISYFSGFSVVTNPVTRRARNVPTLRGAPVSDTVLSYAVNPLVASQRRRNLQSA